MSGIQKENESLEDQITQHSPRAERSISTKAFLGREHTFVVPSVPKAVGVHVCMRHQYASEFISYLKQRQGWDQSKCVEPPWIHSGLWLKMFVAVGEIGYILGSNDVKRLSLQDPCTAVFKLPCRHHPPSLPSSNSSNCFFEPCPTTSEALAQLALKKSNK